VKPGTRDSHPDPAAGSDPGPVGGAGAGQHPAVPHVRGAATAVLLRVRLGGRAGSAPGAYEWISAAQGYAQIYLRSVVFGGAAFIVPVHPSDRGQMGAHRQVEAAADPHLEPWVLPLLGSSRRWSSRTPWRWWPPARRCTRGYLRALGAQGRARDGDLHPARAGVHRPAHHRPGHGDPQGVVPQLLPGLRGLDPGPAGVTIGRNVFIGEKTVLDINTSMGDVSQLGHTSALHSGQRVRTGERWHGSPAQRTDLNYLRVSSRPCGRWRRFRFQRHHPDLRVLPVPAADRGRHVRPC